MTARSRYGRRLAAGLCVTACVLPLAPPALADDARTDTSLGGYRITSIAAPLRVMLDDPAVPIPRPADAAIVEADPAYTYTTLSTGPQARAVASSLWPGTLFGDGLTQVAPGAPDYPVKADAQYPGLPHTATSQFPGMQASALGLDVTATARSLSSPVPGNLDLGMADSGSTSTVDKGTAIGRTVSEVQDVSLLGGLIRVKGVRSELSARSDGRTPTSSGLTTVSGLTIAGVGYDVDDQGVRVSSPAPVPAVPRPDTSALAALNALGITVDPVSQTSGKAGTTATRTATGLRIVVDTVVLRKELDSVPMLNQTLASVYSQVPLIPGLPVDNQSLLFYTLAATPKLTFILAAGMASSAANLPIVFNYPNPLPPLPGQAVGVAGGGGAGNALPPVPASLAPVTGGGTPTPGTVPGPQLANGLVPLAAPRSLAPGFGGLGLGLLLLALAVAAVGGRGLMALRALAFGAAGAGCSLGVPKSVPDLRGE